VTFLNWYNVTLSYWDYRKNSELSKVISRPVLKHGYPCLRTGLELLREMLMIYLRRGKKRRFKPRLKKRGIRNLLYFDRLITYPFLLFLPGKEPCPRYLSGY